MSASVAAVIVAGGRGVRAGGGVPKQYATIGGEMVIRYCLRQFIDHARIDCVQPVVHLDDMELYARASAGLDALPPAPGGHTRQASVLAGLEALAPRQPDIVLVHDAARPFASPALIARAVEAARRTGACVPALALHDTIKVVDAGGGIVDTLDRTTLRAVQTPQAFAFAALIAAHRKAAAAGRDDFTDDAALAEWGGIKVSVFEGEEDNRKLTTADDIARADARLLAELGDVRSATGYDVHCFADGDHVMLGGVRIPHTHGVRGHSDADVALHALVDAILGTLADGDIGAHFPPSDPQWRGAASEVFLRFAVERVRERGGRIAHLDIAIVCEAPRVGPHRDAMRARIAAIAGIAGDRVAVKATTNEKLGFLGRGEGLAAFATATVRLPWSA
ncbi:MAG: bifunctional 2-C-methyl-D-erythritol 4-phosphate cytidylyltransferase/2-C-methyl-D-erythritol 2,4-cyclodiphosphate synthase [Proteobacteria bacterium]|nr:bifunctional 2-C-methyl-D-erythritol 4-phosphate cytidylyltransferase/2-C-methyl-D-erythritol 2,4-cyclodiphosphate synthase [Pseudomonadota bacterium]